MKMNAIGNQTVTPHPPLSWFAEFLEYPKDASVVRWEAARQRLGEFFPGAGDILGRFLEAASKMELGELESLYLCTFEIAAPCIPYISIHLFGEESFERGAFMAKLLDRYGQLEFHAGEELPDHLSVMLRFADRVEGEELRELLQYCLLRPVQIMMERLEASNPYVQVLASLLEILRGRFPGLKAAPLPVEQKRTHSPCHEPAAYSPVCGDGSCGPKETLATANNL